MTNAVVQTQGLQKRFGKELVLDDLDLSIAAGQVVGLLGTNGSGKTTLLKCLLGLLRTTSGNCTVFDEDSWELSAASKARIGYVSQDFSMLSWMTVAAICDYTGAFYPRWDTPFVGNLIREWELPVKKRIGTLSIGQQQKLAVILALGHRPELLILDEPVASLDPIARRRFIQSLIDFAGQDLHTVLFSTHITSDLERIATHVLLLQRGRVGYHGELDQLKESCKRIRIQAARPLPPNLQLPGTIRQQIQGEQALVAVSEFHAELVPFISQQWGAAVQVEDLNLEEIFLEMNGATAPDAAGESIA